MAITGDEAVGIDNMSFHFSQSRKYLSNLLVAFFIVKRIWR
jgi:hypothetical protein